MLFSKDLFKQLDLLHTVDSTNEYLKRCVEEKRARIVLAEEQTSGKGRYGRRWYSRFGEGVYVSYLLYPDWKEYRAPFLNQIAVLAVMSTIRERGNSDLDLRLKLPNDVLVSGKKVCGILSELSCLEGRINWAIIGIGVNLFQTSFPPALCFKATSLTLEKVSLSDPLDFFRHLTEHLEAVYRRLERGDWEKVQEEFDCLSRAFRSPVGSEMSS